MRIKLRAAALAAAMIGFAIGAAPVASAVNCSLGQYCIHENVDFGGSTCYFTGDDYNYTNDNCGGLNADNITSSYSNYARQANFDDIYGYRHVNNTADTLWYATRGTFRSWVSPCNAEPCNDQASGHKWV
ncbi:hypothetical protein [Actinokineospora globicatena]|uniref:Peptidase inhibitor family I36 n=1 Tax=Actinokineospora globicatena TaxID=103729 RepID=A0A9W6QIC7_9PSEU|nr:hypothetical protein [Actinokineospora globicatena]GLW91636.1 hypothetical protein Aglo03_24520 [Actinokineospora globicatena]